MIYQDKIEIRIERFAKTYWVWFMIKTAVETLTCIIRLVDKGLTFQCNLRGQVIYPEIQDFVFANNFYLHATLYNLTTYITMCVM